MRRLINTLLVGGGIAVLVWTIGLVRFVATLPADVSADRTRSDAIVVLTGGSDRLATGLKLLREDYASRLFISGVAEGVSTDRLLEQLGTGRLPGDLRPRVAPWATRRPAHARKRPRNRRLVPRGRHPFDPAGHRRLSHEAQPAGVSSA
jgi:hypothetical protein